MQTPRRSPKTGASDSDMFARKRKRGYRGFQETPLFPVGYQSGKDRYPLETRDTCPRPILNAWRNSLTALSQRYNLYFVASEERLLVFQPTLPDQRVPAHPALAVSLPISRSGLRGHLPGANPHSVNNMLVGNLGDEELILLACDDGDVIGIWTNDIVRSSEAVESAEHTEGRALQMPTPYFLENVGQSAWGIAVHSEARLIAVSSNSHRVTVWAPALTESAPTTLYDSYIDQEVAGSGLESVVYSGSNTVPGRPSRRTSPKVTLSSRRYKSQRRTLRFHETNIPSISFCNTPDDPLGRYLASTDIEGTTVIWDVNRGVPARTLVPSIDDAGLRRDLDGYDPYHAGWGVLFLDRRSFKPTTSIVGAMGACMSISRDIVSSSSYRSPASYKQRISVYDITESRETVKNAGRWTIGDQKDVKHDNGRRGLGIAIPAESTARPTPLPENLILGNGYQEGDERVEDSDDGLSTLDTPGLPSPPSSPRHSRSPTRPSHSGRDSAIAGESYRKNLTGAIHKVTIPSHVTDSMLRYCRWPMLSKRSLQTSTIMHQPSICIPHAKAMPDSPLLTMSVHSLNLFQSSTLLNPPNLGTNMYLRDVEPEHQSFIDAGLIQPPDPADPGPAISLDDPLKQDMAPVLKDALDRHDRLNLFTQIPELGVVLVGSPKGRVAVMTLHQLVPDRNAEGAEERANDLEVPVYTMRLDHLLPTSEQEEMRQRPSQQLVGVSASPTFGASGARSTERWRVLLLYRDHTVLAYELSFPAV